ncbi:MAG: hypothetical protein ACAH59_06305 [Pseudobdellovibrionaceae bacterium]
MNDQELKNLFKSMDHGKPSEIEVARWKRFLRQEFQSRTPREWARLAVACLIGVIIGATAFYGRKQQTSDSDFSSEDATIEMIHVNL